MAHLHVYPAAEYAMGQLCAVCWGSGFKTVGMCIIYTIVRKSLSGPSQWSNQGILALFRDLFM